MSARIEDSNFRLIKVKNVGLKIDYIFFLLLIQIALNKPIETQPVFKKTHLAIIYLNK